MDVRFDLKSNIAEKADADRAAVKSLRAELEAAGASTDKLADAGAKASDKAGAFSSGKDFGKSPWENFAGKGGAARAAGHDAWTKRNDIYKAVGAYKLEQQAADDAAKAKERAAAKKETAEARALAKSKARQGAEMAFGAVAGAAGVSGLASVGKLAMGYQGMARLQALGFRTEVQMRQLFKGVDSAPAVRAADRFLNSIFNRSSATGKALAGMFERGFGGFFAMLERNQPLITSFFQGAIIAGLKLEETYYVLAEAALPFTSAVEDTIGPLGEMKVAAYAGEAAVGALVLTASGAAAPFVAAAVAVGLLVEQIQKLKKEGGTWKDFHGAINNKLRGDLGFETQEEFDAKRRTPGEGESGGGMSAAGLEDFNAKRAAAMAAADAAAGAESGKEYANGVAVGLLNGAAAVDEAAVLLAKYTDAGFRRGAKIRSPSKVAEETAGFWPQGAVKGIEGGARAVQEASDRMVPSLPGAASGGGSGGGLARLELNVNVQVQGGGGSVADEGLMRVIAQKVFGEEFQAALLSLGIRVIA